MQIGKHITKTGSREGSILLETVIAIPLFMILLGGIMWIGDLMVTRQKLVVADRYVVWNQMSRYNPGGTGTGAIHQKFFDSSEHRTVTRVEVDKEDFDWIRKSFGIVQLKMRMPDWTRFMFNAGNVMFGTGVPEEQMELVGRSKGGGHCVLMRTKAEAEPGYIRNRYGVDESGQVYVKWRDIYGEKWPYE